MINLKGVELHRVKLKRWIELEEIREGIQKAVGKARVIGDLILRYISTASALDYSEDYWLDVIDAFTAIQALNSPKQFPILQVRQTPKQEIYGFTYEGREWYFWLHTLASAYGWNIEYVAELDIDDAIALLQEVIYEDFSNKEWEWGLSEVAYEYDKKGKGKLKPIPKPKWLTPVVKIRQPQKVKIRKEHMPVGNVISAEEIKRIYSKEKTNTAGSTEPNTDKEA